MQQTLLLTLQGPRRKLDMELPGDVPINDLLPHLQQICGDALDNGTWLISRLTTGKPLQTAHTLIDNKVLTGEILVLHKEGSPIRPLLATPQRVPATPAPGGTITITWEK
jgi:hypothetical protein